MSALAAIGTYLPPWGSEKARLGGLDEDALTMAVEAGLAARSASDVAVTNVVFISRSLPLVIGGNSAVLLAGLGLANDTEVIEQVGGAPAVLDALATAGPGTMVLAADLDEGAGAGAALIGPGPGATVTSRGRVHRSLPVRAQSLDGVLHEDDDPRLVRERGTRASFQGLALDAVPFVVAGLSPRETAAFSGPNPPVLPATGAFSAIFALAAAAESGAEQLIVAVEQATASAAALGAGTTPVVRVEPEPHSPEKRRTHPGPDIKIAFTAYDRAFDSKVAWEAGECPSCGTLALPPRHRCLECGEEGTSVLVALPRTAFVYTQTTIHIPVPGLSTPYSLAVIELDGVGVRSLATVTDSEPDTAGIGSTGRMVLRRVATRSGVPDYGYAFSPDGIVHRPAYVEATISGGTR